MRSTLDLARRGIWIVAGLCCVAVGGVGIVVPGLPTTVFFVAAAWCFTRSSPRLERWVLGLPHIGLAVRRYRAGLGMPRRAKRWATAMIVVFTMVSTVIVDATALRIAIPLVGAIGVWFVNARVPTCTDDALVDEALDPAGA